MFTCDQCGKTYQAPNCFANHRKHCLKNGDDLCRKFWSLVEIGRMDDCWNWLGNLAGAGFVKGVGYPPERGYGQLPWKKVKHSAHRLAWELTFGDIPDGLWVLHECDNCRCCNPNHLFLGDCKANHEDMMEKGRTSATITDATVLEVYRLRGMKLSYGSIASQLMISKSAVAHILRGRTRKHLFERFNHETGQASSGIGG